MQCEPDPACPRASLCMILAVNGCHPAGWQVLRNGDGISFYRAHAVISPDGVEAGPGITLPPDVHEAVKSEVAARMARREDGDYWIEVDEAGDGS